MFEVLTFPNMVRERFSILVSCGFSFVALKVLLMSGATELRH